MTITEKINFLEEQCRLYPDCKNCPLNGLIPSPCDFKGMGEYRLDILVQKFKDVEAAKSDPVEHPSHYCRDGAMETIDEMILIFGPYETMNFCKLNAWKYRARAMNKNGSEDMKKSDWYLRKYKELASKYNGRVTR